MFRDVPRRAGTIDWSVFDSTGRWLGTVSLPADLDVRLIHQDRIFAVRTDDYEVEHVLVFRIRRGAGAGAPE